MEFIAAIVAIVAIVLVFSLRNRVALLERHIAFLNQHLASGRTAPPQAMPEPAPEAPLPDEMPVPPAPAERMKEAGIEQLGQESFAPPPPPPPPPPPAPPPAPETAKSFEERFGASWVVWIGG